MAVPRYSSTSAWPLLSAGFRPFFLLAGIWACTVVGLWILLLRGVVVLPTAFDLVAWHYHELIYGFVAAAMAGFLLTAIPNWTGRLPLQGWPLGGLVLLWVLGRVAVSYSYSVGLWTAAVLDMSFLVVFAAVVAREIAAGRNWRNLPILVALGLLILANAMSHAGAMGYFIWQDTGKRLALSVVVMLIALIGGRIIPSFTTNWLRRQEAENLPAPFGTYDRATLIISILALAAWVMMDVTPLSGTALIVAGGLHAVRLARWRGAATGGEALLWILHVGYAWLPIGLLLLGLAAWQPDLGTSALHALTVGGMGTMILAVMTRASLGHTKRELVAGRGTIVAYVLIMAAALARVTAPLYGNGFLLAVEIAAGAWIAAYALFVALYLPLYGRR